MSQIVCLGYLIVPVSPIEVSPFLRAAGSCKAYLHRGTSKVHIISKASKRIADLSEEKSQHVGSLLGAVGNVSRNVKQYHYESQAEGVYFNAYIVLIPSQALQLRACIFTNTRHQREVLAVFQAAEIEVCQIPNYKAEVFFGIQQLQQGIQTGQDPVGENWDNLRIEGCKTHLLEHQKKGVKFIYSNEMKDSTAQMKDLWHRPSTTWIRRVYNLVSSEEEDEDFGYNATGSILADDMGLGKTLTALCLVQHTKQDALRFGGQSRRDQQGFPCSTATLIICPLSTLMNWENEINMHFERGSIPYVVFHGESREKYTEESLLNKAVVLTTYETVAPPLPTAGTASSWMEKQRKCNINLISWFRVILDEAHYIKDPKATRSGVITSLMAQRRLCLTGTPLQNHLSDLHSLVQFLKVRPWNNHLIWKGIEKMVKEGTKEGVVTLNQLMEAISIRRLKNSILQLPRKIEQGITVRLGEQWEKTYQDNHLYFVNQFGKNREPGMGWDPGEFFRTLSYLKKFCDHPALTEESTRAEYSWSDGAKVVHLIEDLNKFFSGDHRHITNPKAVVFSEYGRFLEIIKIGLDQHGIGYTELVGSLDVRRREKNLATFRTDNECKVLLSTIRCGGVGIDLRCAQNVYIMEPSWNPAVEEQAVDRLYRMGQRYEVNVLRYFVAGSVEINIQQLKRRKQELSMISVPKSGNEEYELANLIAESSGKR